MNEPRVIKWHASDHAAEVSDPVLKTKKAEAKAYTPSKRKSPKDFFKTIILIQIDTMHVSKSYLTYLWGKQNNDKTISLWETEML